MNILNIRIRNIRFNPNERFLLRVRSGIKGGQSRALANELSAITLGED